MYQVLATGQNSAAMERFVPEWLGTLMDYDASQGGQLVTTLTEYLECGGNYDATAKVPLVHRSTLKYRLRRIREVSGYSLRMPDTRFNLQLAARARRIMQALFRALRSPGWLARRGQYVQPGGTVSPGYGSPMLNAELVARCAVTRNELQRHAYVHHLEEHLQLTVSGGGAAGPEAAVLLVCGALTADDRPKAVELAAAAEQLQRTPGPAIADLEAAGARARGLLQQDPAALELAARRYSTPLGRAWATRGRRNGLGAARRPGHVCIHPAERGPCPLPAAGSRRTSTARSAPLLRAAGSLVRHWRQADRDKPAFGWASLTETERRVAHLAAESIGAAAGRRASATGPIGRHRRRLVRCRC